MTSDAKKTCFDDGILSDDDDDDGSGGGEGGLKNRTGMRKFTIVEVKSERRKNRQKVVNE